MHVPRLLVLGALLTGVGCGSGSSTGPYGGGGSGTPGAKEVWAQNTAFNPATKTVTAGTVITFTNMDGITHTVTSSSVPTGATAFNQTLNGGATFQVTFTTAGTYQYYCMIHGSPGAGMHGTITVQ